LFEWRRHKITANVQAFVFVAEFEIRQPTKMLIKDIKADDKISCLIYNVVPELQMIAK